MTTSTETMVRLRPCGFCHARKDEACHTKSGITLSTSHADRFVRARANGLLPKSRAVCGCGHLRITHHPGDCPACLGPACDTWS